MNQPPRIAIGSLLTECNHLGGQPTDLRRFELYELRRGPEILDSTAGVVGGMLHELRERKADIAPLLVATTCPGGPLTSVCYRHLKSEMLDLLRKALPVDGVLLSLHGSATVEDVGDLEGDLLLAVRNLVGERIPTVATLDPHGHVTAQMVREADALMGWETYPHKDTFESGIRGARLLFDILDGKIKPTMVMGKVPVLVSGVHGHTEGEGPFADVMRFAKSHEGKNGVVSTSAFLVHPYLDLPDMGGGGLVITDHDMEKAVRLAGEIAMRYWERRFDLDPPVFTPAEAIARGRKIAGGPILLVETADCSGGGAAGDSVATLRALLETPVNELSLAPVVDPEAAAQCQRAGVGREVTLSIGHKLDPQWGKPLTVTGKILKLSDGRFQYRGGVWGGQGGNMGASAVLQISAVQALITTHATYDWADEQFSAVGMDARAAKFVVVKNPMNYRLGYAGISKAAFILDTPGPTPATLHHVKYKNLRRPYYPTDKDIPGLKPAIYRSKQR